MSARLMNNIIKWKMIIQQHASKKKVFLIEFLVLITTLPAITACVAFDTFRPFSNGEELLDFSFEYPKDWTIDIMERYSDLAYADMSGPKDSELQVSFNVWLHPEKDALSMIRDNLLANERQRNFNLISQDIISLDGFKGFQVQYSYNAMSNPHNPVLPPEERSYIPIRIKDIAVERDNKIYEINISARQDEWQEREKYIQHILDTFKWK